ncbi:hypothetical protein TKK_0010294 [Trichogramma kaykai]
MVLTNPMTAAKLQAFFAKQGHRFLCGGDWNAKHPWWGSRLPTPSPRGRPLHVAIQNQNYFIIFTGKPTSWPSDPNKRPDLINFAIAKGINKKFSVRFSLDLTSDQSPVIITINLQLKTTFHTRTKIRLKKFNEIVPERLHCGIPLRTVQDIESSVKSFNETLQFAVSDATTTTVISRKQSLIPNEIEAKIIEKRKLRKVCQSTRSATNKRRLKKAIRKLKVLLHEERDS